MSVPTRLRCLLPGHSLLPALSSQGNDWIKCSLDLAYLLSYKTKSITGSRAARTRQPRPYPGDRQFHSDVVKGSGAQVNNDTPGNVAYRRAASSQEAWSRAQAVPAREPEGSENCSGRAPGAQALGLRSRIRRLQAALSDSGRQERSRHPADGSSSPAAASTVGSSEGSGVSSPTELNITVAPAVAAVDSGRPFEGPHGRRYMPDAIVPDRLHTSVTAADAATTGGAGGDDVDTGGCRDGIVGVGSAGTGDTCLVALDRDAELMRRIEELQTLRDAEILLYNAGSWFRSRHAAALLGRLPNLDLEASNSGARTRHLLRFLTLGMMKEVEGVDGPSLARAVATYARLSYAPPEAVPQICSSLLSYYGRKLRSCGAAELADLAWGLAALHMLYGDVHQAIKRPSYTAKLSPGARIVGFVRGESSSAAAEGELGGCAGATLIALNGADGGAVQVLAEGGESRRTQGWVGLVGGWAKAGVATPELQARRETDGTASESAVHGSGGIVEAGAADGSRTALEAMSDGAVVETAVADGATAAAAAAGGRAEAAEAGAEVEAVEAAPLLPRQRRRRLGARRPGVSNAAVLSTAVAGPRLSGGALTRQRKAQDMIWMVPVAMERIWEKLALAAAARAAQGQMQGEHLARVAWAYAKVGIHEPRLFDQLAAATLNLLQPFLDKAQQRAAVGVAAPTAPYGAGGDAAVALGPAPLDPTSVTNLAWAFVKLGHLHPRLLAALAALAAPYKGMYENDQMALLARSYAQAGHYDEALCTAFTMVASRRLRHLSGSQLVALVGSTAALGHRDDQLAGAGARGLASAVQEKRGQLSAEEVCELLWACAHVGLDAPLGSATPGAAVLGLSPVATAAGGRRRCRRAISAGALSSSPTAVALASTLLGRCDGLPPAELARALWALSVLQLNDHGRLLARLVVELTHQLLRHPPESFSRAALLQLYGAAHALAEALPSEGLTAAAEGVDGVKEGDGAGVGGAAESIEGLWGEEEEEGDDDDDDDDEGEVALQEGSGCRAAGGGYRLRAHPGVQLFMEGAEGRRETKLMKPRGYRTAAGAASGEPGEADVRNGNRNDNDACPDGSGGGGAAGSAVLHPLGAVLPCGDSDREPLGLDGSHEEGQQLQRPPARGSKGKRRHVQRHFDRDRVWDPYDSSWSSVDWDKLCIPTPAASAGVPPDASAPLCPPLGSSSPETTAKSRGGAPGNIPSYDVRQVCDEASGRLLWEIVPKATSVQGAAPPASDPAARLLPGGLLGACQQAAAEWAAGEVARLEAEEGEDRELWRLEVALALRDLTGVEPQQRRVTRHNTAVADLLLLLPAGSGVAATRGASLPSPPPPPVAVLLLGPNETTRNPPYVPLGAARLRQRLLEAEGVQVVMLPRFLWRIMGATPEEQMCLLGNILGDGI